MSDDDEDAGLRDQRSDEIDPRDGGIDFTRYSIEQLRELQYSFDEQRSPKKFDSPLTPYEAVLLRPGGMTHVLGPGSGQLPAR